MDITQLFGSVASFFSPAAPAAPAAAATRAETTQGEPPRSFGLPAWLIGMGQAVAQTVGAGVEAAAARQEKVRGEAAALAGQSFAHQEDIDRALAGKTADEIRELEREYEALTGKSFQARFGADLSRWDPELNAEAATTATAIGGMTFATQAEVDGYFAGKTRAEILALRRAWDAEHPDYTWDQRFGTDYSRWAPPVENADVDQKKVGDAVDKMLAAEGLASYDAQAILDQMRGKSGAELEEMRRIFRERMDGESMDAWVAKAMEGMTGLGAGGDVAEAQAILSGDPIAGAVAGLENAAFGGYTSWGTDKDKLMKVLDGLDDAQRRGVIERYDAAHPDEPIGTMLAGELSGSDADKAAALLDGDKAAAKAIDMDEALHGGWFGHAMDAVGLGTGTDEGAAEGVFDACQTEADRQEFLRAYYIRRNGAPPADDAAALAYFKGEAVSEAAGAQQDVLVGLAEGDKVAVAAGRLEIARDGFWGPDLEAMGQQMEHGIDREKWRKLSPEEREQALAEHRDFQAKLEAHWGTKYGGGGDDAFDRMIAFSTASALDLIPGHENLEARRMQQLRSDGRMTDAFMARYAMSGIGTSDEMLQDVVRGMNEDEMARFLEDFKAETGEDFETWIAEDTSGRLYHDLHTATLYGDEPEKLENKLAKEEADYDFELGSGEGVLGGVVEGLSSKDDRMKRQHERIAELTAEMGEHPTPEQLAELDKLLGWQKSDQKQWRSDVDTVSESAATVAELAALAAVTFATGGGTSAGFLALLGTESAATGATVAAMGGAALAGLSKMAVKRGVSGAAYGAEAFGTDLAMTLGEVGTAGLMRTGFIKDGLGAASKLITSNELLQKVVTGALNGGLGGLIQQGIIGNLLDPENWHGGNDAGDVLWSILGSVMGGAKGGAVGAALAPLGGQLGKDNPLAWGAMRGGLDSVVGAALSADTYQGNVGLNFLGAGVRGTLRGGIDAYGDQKLEAAEALEQEKLAQDPYRSAPLASEADRAELRALLEGASAQAEPDVEPIATRPAAVAEGYVDSSPTTDDPQVLLGIKLGPSGAPITVDDDMQIVQQAANPEAVQARARAELAEMDPDAQQWMREMALYAQNDAQRAMIERAIAAGRDPGDVIRLAGDMVGKDDAEILQHYTGAGMWQKYQQSCAPTAYQIALSQVDPVAAMEYREGQIYAAMQQEDALAAQGVRPSPRQFSTPAIDQALASDLDLYDHLAATSDPRSTAPGIDPSRLKSSQLHADLEAATGGEYEFQARTGNPYADVDRNFDADAIPFADMQAALDENKPVMFGSGGHRRTIVGYGNDPGTGEPVYITIDPYTGGYKLIPQGQLETDLAPNSLTIPKRDGAAAPAVAPESGTTAEGALRYSDLRRRYGVDVIDELPGLGIRIDEDDYVPELIPEVLSPDPPPPPGPDPISKFPGAGDVIDPMGDREPPSLDAAFADPDLKQVVADLGPQRAGEDDRAFRRRLRAAGQDLVEFAPYDPTTRTQMELLSDLRAQHNGDGRFELAQPRDFFLVEDTELAAGNRSELARQELERRAELRRAALDEQYAEAPAIDIASNDAIYADQNAHTLDRHVTPEMTGDGQTIKGRPAGGPGWDGTSPTSVACKWNDLGEANRWINQLLRQNWDDIKTALSDNGYYDAEVDTEEDIGKGYRYQGGTVDERRTEKPQVLRQLSSFQLRLRMIEGNPPRIFVLTSFPKP